jgi:GMP synthase (glutamine-hydrolysing)
VSRPALPRVLLVAPDGPAGRLEAWLSAAGAAVSRAAELPVRFDADALVLTGAGLTDGGVAGRDAGALAAVLASDRPVLATGTGGLLAVTAAGGRVSAAPARRGPGLVRRADAAALDPVFAAVPFLPDVVWWSEQRVADPPPGATVLAAGTDDPYPALRLGPRCWATTFLLDAGPEQLAAWARAAGLDPEPLLAELAGLDLARTWGGALQRFVALAGG